MHSRSFYPSIFIFGQVSNAKHSLAVGIKTCSGTAWIDYSIMSFLPQYSDYIGAIGKIQCIWKFVRKWKLARFVLIDCSSTECDWEIIYRLHATCRLPTYIRFTSSHPIFHRQFSLRQIFPLKKRRLSIQDSSCEIISASVTSSRSEQTSTLTILRCTVISLHWLHNSYHQTEKGLR